MMKMNAGAWIGIIAGIGGLLVGVIVVIMTAGTLGIYIASGMIILFGGMFYLFYRLFFKPMINANRLQKIGISGKAKIIEVKDTGVTINNSPQVKLIVEVKNTFGQKYNTSIRTLVSRINPFVYQPGMEVPVKIDPNNEQNVVIDFSNNNSTAASAASTTTFTQPDQNALKTELEQLQKDTEAVRLSGRAARAIIKKYTWLGVYVNGNNQYAEIELEVLPDSSPAFGGKTKAVIHETSIQKYQAGKEIFVKYDLYDNSKIAIDHS